MNRYQILDLIRSLACSTGLYGRRLQEIASLNEDDREETFERWEAMNFKSDLEFIRYYEEGVLPEDYTAPDMTDKEIKQAVAEQLANMLMNNIVGDNGVESFRGWLEDGEAFRLNGMNEGDVQKAMALALKLETATDTINEVLGEHPWE